MALAFAAMRPAALHWVACLALGGLAGWTMLRSGFSLDTLALAGGCLLVFMAAGVAAAASSQQALIRSLAIAWLAAAILSTVIALLQYFGLAERLAPWVSVSPLGEAFANLRQRNQFASLTVIGIAALLWLVSRGPGRALSAAAMALLAIGNAATTSRTGLVQILMLVLMMAFWSWLRRSVPVTVTPVGRWTRRTALSVLFRCCPPGPPPTKNVSSHSASSASSGRATARRAAARSSSGITSPTVGPFAPSDDDARPRAGWSRLHARGAAR